MAKFYVEANQNPYAPPIVYRSDSVVGNESSSKVRNLELESDMGTMYWMNLLGCLCMAISGFAMMLMAIPAVGDDINVLFLLCVAIIDLVFGIVGIYYSVLFGKFQNSGRQFVRFVLYLNIMSPVSWYYLDKTSEDSAGFMFTDNYRKIISKSPNVRAPITPFGWFTIVSGCIGLLGSGILLVIGMIAFAVGLLY